MEDIKKELLSKAIDSILHGSTLTYTENDMNGNPMIRTVQINDLRQPLLNKLADKLAQSEEFKKKVAELFTDDFIKQLQQRALERMTFSDLPWDVKRKVEGEMKTMNVSFRKLKLVVEVQEED